MTTSKLAAALLIGSFLLSAALRAEPMPQATETQTPLPSELADRLPYAEKILELMHDRRSSEVWRDVFLDPAFTPKCNCKLSSTDSQRVIEAWHRAVWDGYDIDLKFKYGATELARSLEISEMSEWIAYYETDLGRRLYTAETPKKLNKNFNEEWAELLRSSKELLVDPDRRTLIKQLLNRSRTLELVVAHASNLQLSGVIGMKAFSLASVLDLDIAEISQMIEAIQNSVMAQYEPMLLPSVAPIYRSFTNAELQIYVDELSKPKSQKIVHAIIKTHEKVLRAQAFEIGTRFGKYLQETKL